MRSQHRKPVRRYHRLAIAATALLAAALSSAAAAVACEPRNGAWDLKNKDPFGNRGVRALDFRVDRCSKKQRAGSNDGRCVLDLKLEWKQQFAGPTTRPPEFTHRIEAAELQRGILRYRDDDPETILRGINLALHEERGSAEVVLEPEFSGDRGEEIDLVVIRRSD